jgi:hypothetical protein
LTPSDARDHGASIGAKKNGGWRVGFGDIRGTKKRQPRHKNCKKKKSRENKLTKLNEKAIAVRKRARKLMMKITPSDAENEGASIGVKKNGGWWVIFGDTGGTKQCTKKKRKKKKKKVSQKKIIFKITKPTFPDAIPTQSAQF